MNLRARTNPATLPALLAAATTTAAVAALGRRDTGSALAPLNATSHVLWGPRAAAVERVTLNHTLPGVLINAGAAGFWALMMRGLFGGRRWAQSRSGALAAGGATAGLAYLVDYHLVPRRLTPGWELRLSPRSLGLAFAALALGLGVGAALARRAP